MRRGRRQRCFQCDDDFWSVFYRVCNSFSRKKRTRRTRMKAATTAFRKLVFVARERAEFSSSARTFVWNASMKIQARVIRTCLRYYAHLSSKSLMKYIISISTYLPPSILRMTNLATFSNTRNATPTIIRTPAERIHVAATVASAASGLKASGLLC